MLTASMTSPTMISGIPGGAEGAPDGLAGVGFDTTLNWMTADFMFPAASYARTDTMWVPTVQVRMSVACKPTETNAEPSMATSYRAIPEPPSDPDHETESPGAKGTLGTFATREGGVESTLIAADLEASEYPWASVARYSRT